VYIHPKALRILKEDLDDHPAKKRASKTLLWYVLPRKKTPKLPWNSWVNKVCEKHLPAVVAPTNT